MMTKILSLKNFSLFFFIAYLLTGIFIFRDTGISWDEESNRIGTALPEFNFVFHGDAQHLITSTEKYHGPSFELVLLGAERILNITDSREIYFLRHFLTFFFFWLSSVFLFLLSKKLFSGPVAIICLLMYVLSPRIFGESFYNSKDIGFLSFFTISLYTLHRFLENKNMVNALMHALVTGFMTDIRIMGLIMPLMTIVILIVDLIFKRQNIFAGKNAGLIFFYVILQSGFIILFWPVLWLNPVFHLKEAFAQMSNYPWHGVMLFEGRQIFNNQLPWNYVPLWIFITVPVVYTLFFVTGFALLIWSLRKDFLEKVFQNKFILLLFFITLAPVIMVIAFHSVVYDGWRHLYFIYAPFILMAGYGTEKIFQAINSDAKKILTGVFALQFLMIIVQISTDYPYEHVYFNWPAKKIFSPIAQQFDMDYWGLTYRDGFEYILNADTSSSIHVRVENDPGIYNVSVLRKEQRSRISIHENLHEGDYWLAEFRGRPIVPENVNAEIVHRIENSSGTLLTIYRGLRSTTPAQIIFQSSDSSGSAFSERLDSHLNTTDPISFTADTIHEDEIEELQISALAQTETANPNTVIVTSVMRNDSSVFWSQESFQNMLTSTRDWIPLKWNTTFPQKLVMAGDKISVYIWNVNSTKMIVNDFSVTAVKYKTGASFRLLKE